jgi:hypothetical protein
MKKGSIIVSTLVIALFCGLLAFQFLVHMWVYARNSGLSVMSWETIVSVLCLSLVAIALALLWGFFFRR